MSVKVTLQLKNKIVVAKKRYFIKYIRNKK